MFDRVDVWLASTDVNVDTSILSADENARASRFRFEKDRGRWTAARVMLRRVLSKYLDSRPSDINFVYSRFGKPSVAGSPIRFNLSHSGDLSVCAIASDMEVGIDIEEIRPVDDLETLFRSVASTHEYTAFRTLPPASRPLFFFETWTVKEACVKAQGTGLSTPLPEIEVALCNIGWRDIESGSRAWPVFTFTPRPGYVGALALYNERGIRVPRYPEIRHLTLFGLEDGGREEATQVGPHEQ